MNFINDCISDKDMLGYEPYIKAFEYLIENQNSLMNLPIVFGIHGKWGVGKSTFMELIKLRLEKSKEYYTININPWEFSNEYNFISIFLAELFRRIKSDLCFDERGIDNGITNFFKSICKPMKISANMQYGTGIGIKAEYDFDKLTFKSQKELVDKYITENYEIKDTIHKILNYEIFENKKLIVFIDDLDRCSSEKVMEVIEAIKLILNSENCIFFLGCDKDYLQSALLIKYKEFIKYLDDNEQQQTFKKFADEYLEKIIQIPFSIPALNEEAIENYIKGLLISPKVGNKPTTSKTDLYRKFKSKLNIRLFSKMLIERNLNPRRIKRTLNLVFLNYLFMNFKIGEENIGNRDIDILILMGLIRDEYIDYYRRYFISEVLCRRTFKIMLELIENENSKNEIEDENIELVIKYEEINNLFKIFFHELKIKNNSDLNKLLDNIANILAISHTTTTETYKESYWGEIGEIKSTTGTNKKLKVFLNRIKENQNQVEFLLWFFNNVYNEEEYYLGIQKNVHVYRNEVNNNHYNNFLYKLSYNDKNDSLEIKFEIGNYTSILSYEEKLGKDNYYDYKNKQIVITQYTSDEEMKSIKEKIYELTNKLV